jgi:hypothetical protein
VNPSYDTRGKTVAWLNGATITDLRGRTIAFLNGSSVYTRNQREIAKFTDGCANETLGMTPGSAEGL